MCKMPSGRASLHLCTNLVKTLKMVHIKKKVGGGEIRVQCFSTALQAGAGLAPDQVPPHSSKEAARYLQREVPM